MIKIIVENRDGIFIFKLIGQLDIETAPELRKEIEQLANAMNVKAVFDLRELNLIDSTGVGTIVALFKRLRLKGGDIKLSHLHGQPREIFQLLGLTQAFGIFDSVVEVFIQTEVVQHQSNVYDGAASSCCVRKSDKKNLQLNP